MKFWKICCFALIATYRSLQTLCTCLNALIKRFRVACHIAIVHILIVLFTFLLMRNYELCFDNGEYGVLFVMATLLSIAMIVIRLECIEIGLVVDTSTSIKEWVVDNTRRKHYFNKAVRSLQVMYLATAGDLFIVSKDTFVEFYNISLDHLINLLCF